MSILLPFVVTANPSRSAYLTADFAGAMGHGCTNCTHLKRYTADLLAEGAVLDENENGVVDAPGPTHVNQNTGGPDVPGGDILPELAAHPTQQERVPGSGHGYACLAVMDGKTITHQICAVSICKQPLVNYKNRCFCKDHLEMGSVCGIIPCGQPVHSDRAVTCNNESHKDWHQKYLNRFSRLSFPGVQRVIWLVKMREMQPRLVLLSTLNFWNSTVQLGTMRFIRSVQGWGKCYSSESSPQVLKIIDNIWESHPDSRPSFLAYDDACNPLHHIVTQNPNSSWIKSTKFIMFYAESGAILPPQMDLNQTSFLFRFGTSPILTMPCDAGAEQRKPISEQTDQTRLRQKGLAAESGNRGGWEIAYSDAARPRSFGVIR
ncbi:hypothetical protein B0H10DRAFT_2188230 [Mycena sp. CBHHK59/15]|nr:hypothetical protein B0H10DRAFT_2188230 [Mycena sp. CBHHK59/15]